MSKSLIIAEKPSVAQDIVRALTPAVGKFDKHDDHFENERYVVTSAVGHLVEIKAPEEYDVKRGKWSFANLPVIPPRFDLAPIDKAKSRLNSIVRLIKRKDITELINACDAGREGELIFRLIVQYAGLTKGQLAKPVKRLWLQSMTPAAIREGFEQLRTDKQMLPLADAARCRSEADWLVGINGTRAMTAFNSRDGGFFLTTVGRVQTPTLSIVVEREEKIRKHVARDYWEVRATFDAQAGPVRRQVVRPEIQEGRERGRGPGRRGPGRAPRRPLVERAGRAGDRRGGARSAGQRIRGSEAELAKQPAAVRPDDLAARSELALRFFGEDDAVARAGALRKAQGADLPAHRLACVARGLRRRRQEHDRHDRERAPARPAARSWRRMRARRSTRAT